ncbi:MAG: methyltransferase domain-containing protein [Bacteroidetes bacterium]|nr:methyltransferase domain-containing protein [Bacteroidota bacterium]
MNQSLNAKYWDDLYLNNDKPWDMGQVSPPLKAYFDQLTNKQISILIPGAGNAYEAEYLVNNGFTNVFVCDYASLPLQNLLERCPQIKPENLLQEDFFKMENKKFDLIVEQTFFCAIDRSLRKEYFEKMNDLLNPKGKLIGLLFNDTLNDDRPPFGGTKEEYEGYFKDIFSPKVYETAYNSLKPRVGRELFMNLEKPNHKAY